MDLVGKIYTDYAPIRLSTYESQAINKMTLSKIFDIKMSCFQMYLFLMK